MGTLYGQGYCRGLKNVVGNPKKSKNAQKLVIYSDFGRSFSGGWDFGKKPEKKLGF